MNDEIEQNGQACRSWWRNCVEEADEEILAIDKMVEAISRLDEETTKIRGLAQEGTGGLLPDTIPLVRGYGDQGHRFRVRRHLSRETIELYRGGKSTEGVAGGANS